jgi:transposase-like protein
MSLHNANLPHLIKRPCRRCAKPTYALQNGQVLRHPTCDECKKHYADEYAKALNQRLGRN